MQGFPPASSSFPRAATRGTSSSTTCRTTVTPWDDKRTKINANDLPDLQDRWKSCDPKKNTDRSTKAFFIPKIDIVNSKYDLSITRYKEEKYEEQEYDEPEDIIEKMEALEVGILDDLKDLKGMINE